LCDDLIVQSGLSLTLQKAECVNIPEMTLHSGMNYAIVLTLFLGTTVVPTAMRWSFSQEN